MFVVEYEIFVDIKKKTQSLIPKFVQYDNASLIFKVQSDGKRYDLSGFTRAEVAHKRPDGKVVVGLATIETTPDGESRIRYNYLGSEMHAVGFVETSLSIFSDDKKVTTQPFRVEIFTDNRDGLVESSKEEVGLLQDLITEVTDILDQAHTAIDSANNAVEIATQATTDATTAITNANLAITNAQNAVDETIKVKDDTLLAKEEAELATINANKIVNSFVHKGEHNMSESYVERNIVNFDGGSYIAIQPSTGISPTDSSYWKLIAKKGDTGAQGIQGVQGEQGERGETGKGFSIAKTYPSVAAMFADYNNPQIPVGSFVLINTSDVNNVENAMMYVKGETEYNYLTDLSGAQGIRGERGERGLQGIQGIQGERGITGEKGETGLGFNWRGTYSNTISYSLNDVVSYNGSSYVALQNTLGNLPTDTASWNMVSQRGVDGEGSVSSVNGIFPDVDGNVTLDLGDTITSIDGFLPNENGNVVTHANKPVLDALTDDAGQLKYKGNPVGRVTSVNGQTGDVTVQGFSGSYNDLTEVPTEFKPEAHSHSINEVTGLSTELAKKVDKVTGKGLSTEDYTSAEKTKLQNIQENANNYIHPTNHPASIITQDANNRFVSDTQISSWNAKETTTGSQAKATQAFNDAKSYSDTHANRKDNPHAVTASQVGAYTKVETDNKITNEIGILSDDVGLDVTTLTTTAKKVVAAINEINAKPTGGDTTEIAKQINTLYDLTTGLIRYRAYDELLKQASSRIDGGTVFAHDMNGNIIGMTLDEANSQNIVIRDGKMLMIAKSEATKNVIDSTVLTSSTYNAIGNGGRKLVRTSDGKLRATLHNSTEIARYVSSDDKLSWTREKFMSPANPVDSASVAVGNNVYTVYTSTNSIDYFKVPQNQLVSIANGFSAAGGCSIEVNHEDTELHVSWSSKDTSNPNAFNIRHSKGIINALDGDVAWGSSENVTTTNTSTSGYASPSTVINGSGQAVVLFTQTTSNNSRIDTKIRLGDNNWGAHTVVYGGGSYTQLSPSAIFAPQRINGLANGLIATAWHGYDATHPSTFYIRFSKSIDGGANWSGMQKLVAGQNASVTADKNGNLYIEYERSGNTYFIKSTNNGDSWSAETLKGVGVNPSTLYDTNLGFTKPLSIRKSTSSVVLNGTWQETAETPALTARVVYNILSTDYVGTFVKKIGATAVQAYVNDTLMDAELVDREYEFTKQLATEAPVKLRLELSRTSTSGGESDAVVRVLGGRS